MLTILMLVVFFTLMVIGILLYAWREMLEWGQVIYIVGSGCVVILSFLFEIYKNPVTGTYHLGCVLNPPTYIDKTVNLGMTEEFYEALKKIPDIDVGDDYVEKAQTREMDRPHRLNRYILIAISLCVVGGWRFLPELINQAIYSTVLKHKRKLKND